MTNRKTPKFLYLLPLCLSLCLGTALLTATSHAQTSVSTNSSDVILRDTGLQDSGGKAIFTDKRQIVYQARVLAIDKNEMKNLPVNWHGMPSSGVGRGLPNLNEQVALLAKAKKVSLLYSPNLSSFEDTQASTFIGDQIDFTNDSQQVVKANIGFTFGVKGQIESNTNSIQLSVHLENSRITFLDKSTEVTIPQISTKSMDTTIRLKENEVVVIAFGDTKQTEQKVENIANVPGLGDLPMLKSLFTHGNKKTVDSQIVVFITAKQQKD
jgi:type II secretory pathway component GspD/PulD (secretin)